MSDLKNDSLTPPQDEEPKQMSLMGGIVRPEGLPEADLGLSDAPSGKLMSQGTLLLVVVVLIAGGTIWAMRQSKVDLKGSGNSKAVEARIEQALAKLSKPDSMAPNDPLAPANMNALFQDTGSIVAMFSTDMTQRQVPIEFIKKDPFQDVNAVEVAPATNNESNKAARERKQRLDIEFSKLKLQTVMQGRVPVAVIDGQFARVGQALGSFTVKSIDAMTVTLSADGQDYVLQMQDKSVNTSNQAIFRQ